MAAAETVRLRLHFDYPPPSSPRCSVFWLLADLTKCRVVTDLASLIRHRFGFSSGAALGLYLDGGLLPPTESARLVRDNDCLRVKLEDVEIVENSVAVSNGLNYSYKKARKRRTTWEEEESDAENDQYTEKHWKGGEISETSSSLEPDQGTRKKNKKRKRNEGGSENNGKWTPKKSGKEKEGKTENKKQKKSPKPSKAKMLPERTKKSHSVQKSASNKNNSAEIKKKKDIGLSGKTKTDTSSDSDSSATSSDDSHTKTSLDGKKLVEKPSFITSKPTGSHPTVDRLIANIGSNAPSVKDKRTQASSSSLDSSSSSDDQGRMPKRAPALAPPPTGTTECPGSSQANGPDTDNHLGTRQEMQYSDLWDKPVLGNSGKQLTPLVPEAAPHPSSFGRGRGRGEDIFPWRGPRGRGFRGMRGRGRGGNINYVFNGESQKQHQLTEVVKNTSIIIQNPVETPQKDYSLLPQLAAPPRVGEKIAFKLLELTADYSPDVSSYKEGKIISYNPDVQEVDIEILSSIPVVKEPGKFDLVYQNENGTEVVEYAVSQDKRITISWKELIEPRLIIEPQSDPPASTEQA